MVPIRFSRALDFRLPPGRSAFLWGARKTGKSTFLRARFPRSPYFDLLDSELFLELSREPHRLGQRLGALDPGLRSEPVILDEVQKVPALLDEVHRLIESSRRSFVLCGSSARKLRRGQGNLLGGRAWRCEMRPLVSAELPDLDLLRALQQGLVPDHYLQAPDDAARSLRAYVHDYLKEEVFAEGLARNVPAFSRFLDAVGYSHGELVNYASIARDCGADGKTVKEYFQILQDTLLGTLLEPYRRRPKRQVILQAPKAYLFDVGVAGALTRRRLEAPKGESFGRAFEHFLFMELSAWRAYRSPDLPIHYWRTKQGAEVDFVLGDAEVAVEVKGASRVDGRDLGGLRMFAEDHRPKTALVVSQEAAPRREGGILHLPWRDFLARLWAGEILKP
jgi:predicted AAA+ superfamily ATPase